GIRDFHVTGVQTCALPIYRINCIVLGNLTSIKFKIFSYAFNWDVHHCFISAGRVEKRIFDKGKAQSIYYYSFNEITLIYTKGLRSEERRVGKACRSRW